MTITEAIAWLNTDDYESVGYNEALEMAIKALEQTRWIPTSERLPEESGEYIITIANYEPHTETSWFYENEKVWSYKNADVVAWMPLPQPYKEGDKNDK